MKQARILLVEDEFIIARNIQRDVTDLGYQVCGIAATGEEAIKLAAEAKPDLILMDVMLAGQMDGIEAANQIGLQYAIPIIYLTAFADKEVLDRAKQTSSFGYLIKPCEQRELHAGIEMALYKSEMEAQLRKSEERFRMVANFTYDWEFWVGTDGQLIYISPSCERITGYSSEEFLADPGLFTRIAHPDDLKPLKDHINQERVLGPTEIVHRIVAKDGSVKWISHCCQSVFSSTGAWLGRRGSNRDISRRKEMEEELLKSKKFEATGILAGGIAHDFNNLLTVIQGNIELAQEESPPGSLAAEFLKEARRACNHAKGLTQKFITVSAGGMPVKATESINGLIQDAVLSLAGSSARAEYLLPKGLWPVEIDAAQVRHALHNLLENAAEAMPGGGVIRITAENIETAEDDVTIKPPLPAGRYVMISVDDQGVGISEENINRIFDPYFSTKDRGSQKGMGLGLTIVYSIVRKHDGYIRVSSTRGLGTRVSVYLPVLHKENGVMPLHSTPVVEE
ncbi:MAG: response regulator [Deltaproteobacteria bacterium]|nr:response regulator [Deltaproteobacteria bacterium]